MALIQRWKQSSVCATKNFTATSSLYIALRPTKKLMLKDVQHGVGKDGAERVALGSVKLVKSKRTFWISVNILN